MEQEQRWLLTTGVMHPGRVAQDVHILTHPGGGQLLPGHCPSLIRNRDSLSEIPVPPRPVSTPKPPPGIRDD